MKILKLNFQDSITVDPMKILKLHFQEDLMEIFILNCQEDPMKILTLNFQDSYYYQKFYQIIK